MNDLFGPIARFWRRLHIGRNPLARSWDRIESALLMVLLAGIALAIPVAGLIGSSNYADTQAVAAREHLSSHRVSATVLATVQAPTMVNEAAGVVPGAGDVLARWTVGGVVHTGTITVPEAAAAGSAVPIWVDATGAPTHEPLTRADAAVAGWFAGGMTLLGATSVLAGLFWAGRRLLDRRRAAQWDRAWVDLAKVS